jgi:hypothetical protein
MVRSVAGMRVIGIMALAGVFVFAAMTPVEQARALYHRTDYAAALKLLLPLEIKDGPAWELAGRIYFMMGDFKHAGEPRALNLAFLRHDGIYRSDVVAKPKAKPKPKPSKPGTGMPPPVGRHPGPVQGRDGRRAPYPSSAMSSGRLFLDRVARQQSPSPLHRHSQNNTHSSEARAKGDISTLPGGRHFYFALTKQKKRLILFRVWDTIIAFRRPHLDVLFVLEPPVTGGSALL